MGYTYSFFDNQTIGAQELNNLAKRFVTEGVADIFTDGLPHNISDLNSIVTANATDGVVPDTVNSLKVYASGSVATISAGTAFFADGTIMEVDSDGISLTFTKGVLNYIYLISDTTTNSCRAECSKTLLSGNNVLLAVIEKDGSVTDKRKYAKGKIPSAYSSALGLITKKEIYWNQADLKNMTPKEIPLSTGTARGMFMYMGESLSKTKTFGFVTFNAKGEADFYISGCLMGSLNGYASAPSLSSSELIIQNGTDVRISLRATASVSDGKVIITPFATVSGGEHEVHADFYVF
ncbi:MAG: hypothetical protein J6A69_12385 [Clostridia bacterium]|nr:hypothetical protein [Clostridia bacterium]